VGKSVNLEENQKYKNTQYDLSCHDIK